MSLPSLDSRYPLDDRAIETFRARGHVQVRTLATPEEVAAYRPAIDAATERHRWDKRPLEARDTYGRSFQQAMNLWRRDSVIAGFTLSARFARVAAALLGCEAVRLYHDQALYKEPGGGGTPWHQDQTYWPFDGDGTVTLWMPLVDVDPDMGPMRFLRGSHRAGALGAEGIGDDTEAYFATRAAADAAQIDEMGPMRAGDASFHAGWTVHGAHPNASARMRAVMTVIYFADGLRVTARPSRLQRRDLEVWLPGCVPGGPAASPLNPVLGVRD
jgi:ectoine hydroxylase-related dioxygenase (phytanoyl-CoA dioxygenase family)